ncbi:transporter substrate-binding domain-containing protein [Vogesella sp. DC21W]|uniref:Transporter substrate-binding domain-containing protein n=1 Tax=Vogesella aquatica TaxID=2984206 RepID=A0ABT5ISY0_9NEIS|nr:transporter substrate-binding domain-containing protein [Vogesella aquatica]MDC7715672.1 transporter substrate-binding domain-containing protein [Vogesella aquatica]
MSALFCRPGWLLLAASTAQAAPPLHIGVAESDAAPIVVLNAQRQLESSLSKDLGLALAQALGSNARFSVLSRNRIEPALEQSMVDVVCNANPAWFGNAARLGWTQDFYPQIERVVTLTSHLRSVHGSQDLTAQRVGVIRGYHYPALVRLWQNNSATRVDHPQLDSGLKALQMGMIDAVVSSELELAAWVKRNPQAGQQLRMQPWVVSMMQTRCAVAPASRYSVAQLNQAITLLEKQGKTKRILQSYRWKTG